MSKAEEAKGVAPYAERENTAFKMPRYSDGFWDDCLALYLKGFGSRNIRRILREKYEVVPTSSTIRQKIAKYPEKIRDAVGRSKEMDILVALAADREYYEDFSQDIMFYARKSLMKDLEADKFDSLPTADKWDRVSKENNMQWQRAQKRIEHLDPSVSQQVPIFIQLAMKQSPDRPMPEEANDSSDSSPTAISAEFKQVADISTTGLLAEGGDTD